MGRQCRQRFSLSGGNYWYEDTCQVVGIRHIYYVVGSVCYMYAQKSLLPLETDGGVHCITNNMF